MVGRKSKSVRGHCNKGASLIVVQTCGKYGICHWLLFRDGIERKLIISASRVAVRPMCRFPVVDVPLEPLSLPISKPKGMHMTSLCEDFAVSKI